MKIGILNTQVPFVSGGAEALATALRAAFLQRGYDTDVITIPFKWYPPSHLLQCMLMSRLVDVTEVNGTRIDRVISLKFPAYFIAHPKNVCWLLHQHRQAYDLYGTPYSDLWQTPDARTIAAEIRRWDNYYLAKTAAIFTISQNVSRRLQKYNGLSSTPLYPPLTDNDFYSGTFERYVLCPGRIDSIKRQHLMIEALGAIPEPLKVVFSGQADSAYAENLRVRIEQIGLSRRVEILGYVSHEQKRTLYANCLAVYYGVRDEDYGYVTLEAFSAGKPVITHTDSGGPLEFVIDGENGYVTEPVPALLAECVRNLADSPARARVLGANGARTLAEKNITWENVIDNLLAP